MKRLGRDAEQTLSCLGCCYDTGSSTRSPFRPSLQRVAPGGETSLARIDFLTIAHQRDDHGPVGVAAQDIEKQRRLALRVAEFAAAKICIPGSLGFIEDDHVLMWRLRPWQVVA